MISFKPSTIWAISSGDAVPYHFPDSFNCHCSYLADFDPRFPGKLWNESSRLEPIEGSSSEIATFALATDISSEYDDSSYSNVGQAKVIGRLTAL